MARIRIASLGFPLPPSSGWCDVARGEVDDGAMHRDRCDGETGWFPPTGRGGVESLVNWTPWSRREVGRWAIATGAFVCTMAGLAPMAGAQPRDLAGPCRTDAPIDLSTVEGTPDVAPRMVSAPPKPPRFTLRAGYRGAVQLAVVVDSTGRVERETATILAATSRELRGWACGFVGGLRFAPATLANRPVRAQAVIPFLFSADVHRVP